MPDALILSACSVDFNTSQYVNPLLDFGDLSATMTRAVHCQSLDERVRSNKLRGMLSRRAVDSVTRGRCSEHETRRPPAQSSISDFCDLPATTTHAASCRPLDGSGKVKEAQENSLTLQPTRS